MYNEGRLFEGRHYTLILSFIEPIPHIISGMVASNQSISCHIFPTYLTCHRVVTIVIQSVSLEPLRERHIDEMQPKTHYDKLIGIVGPKPMTFQAFFGLS